MKILRPHFLLIGVALLAGCAERFNVLVKKDNDAPMAGVVVRIPGSQYHEQAITNGEGIAVVNGIYNMAGVERLSVDYNNKVYTGSVSKDDNQGLIVFYPESDSWNIFDKSGKKVRSEKSINVSEIYVKSAK